MLSRGLPLALSVLVAAPVMAESALPAPGVWTNAEDVYFAQEEGRAPPDWTAIEVREDGHWRRIDAHGDPLGRWSRAPLPGLTGSDEAGWRIDGSELRRARSASCWVAVRKFAGKPDGSDDWTFTNDLATFDQGGRVFVAGNGEAPNATIRLRNVTWAQGSRNRPALVLYVHRDDPDRAISYAWTAPEAPLVGINLRWIQASCAIEEH